MKREILYLGIIAAVFAGCSTSKKLTQGNVIENTSDRVVMDKIKLIPVDDPGMAKRQQEWNEQKAAIDAGKKDDALATHVRNPRAGRPEMTFTASQCEYLQLRGVNPLPAGGVLELDLDAMAGDFCYPVSGVLLSPYGRRGASMHSGVDIKAFPNDTIRAAFPGVVRMAKTYSDYGNLVAIRHYEGFETVYAHGSKILVKNNDVVEAGDPLMLAGRTGRASTEHLHFEVRAGDSHIDPARVIDTYNKSLRSGKLYIGKLNGGIVAYTDDLELQQLNGAKQQAVTAQKTAAQQPTASKTADAVRQEQVAKPAGTSVAPEAVKPEVRIVADTPAAAQNTAVYYRVKKGDTLSAVARKYSTTVVKICQLSNIKPTSLLQINQRLRVK